MNKGNRILSAIAFFELSGKLAGDTNRVKGRCDTVVYWAIRCKETKNKMEDVFKGSEVLNGGLDHVTLLFNVKNDFMWI